MMNVHEQYDVQVQGKTLSITVNNRKEMNHGNRNSDSCVWASRSHHGFLNRAPRLGESLNEIRRRPDQYGNARLPEPAALIAALSIRGIAMVVSLVGTGGFNKIVAARTHPALEPFDRDPGFQPTRRNSDLQNVPDGLARYQQHRLAFDFHDVGIWLKDRAGS